MELKAVRRLSRGFSMPRSDPQDRLTAGFQAIGDTFSERAAENCPNLVFHPFGSWGKLHSDVNEASKNKEE